MWRIILLALSAVVLAPPLAFSRDEKAYQQLYCSGMELEHRLSSGGRVDCLDSEYAIEVDYADKWAEAIGQSLYYAASTQRKPAVILLCPSSQIHEEGLCRSYLYRMDAALRFANQRIKVWECFLDSDRSLSTCLLPQVGP